MVERRLSYKVAPEWDGKKVDIVLRHAMGLSGTQIRRIKFDDTGILLDGERVFVNVIVRTGQVLDALLSDPVVRGDIIPVKGDIDITYEDLDMIVVNKAGGVPAHPSAGHYDDTLGNYIMHYYKERGICADYHPVHRLDSGTTGLMVIAKHPYAQERLTKQLHSNQFCRRYLAVCEGYLVHDTGTIDAPIAHNNVEKLLRVVHPDGAFARTHYEVVKRAKDRTLVRLQLETGRTHQIRVHMAHIGHPLVGDFLYGTERLDLIPRTALHSAELEITHPVTGLELKLQVEIPDEMKKLML